MSEFVIAWDLETVPDLSCVARVHKLDEADQNGCREALGEKFPRHIFHQIVAISALVAERSADGFEVRSLGAPHVGQRPEAELIQSFVDRIADLRPTLVSFNGSGFDLPVLRYRAMINHVSAPGLECRNYFHRYSESHVDLCDVLSCFSSQGKLTLDALCCALGLASPKADGMDGSKVADAVADGRIAEVAAYAEGDVIATYRVWLRWMLFCGRLTRDTYDASEANLLEFVRERVALKPHLSYLLPSPSSPSVAIDSATTEDDASAGVSLAL